MTAFRTPIDDRYFEDYTPGDVHRFGTVTVSAGDIVDFARQFDPQPAHVDPAAAAASPFGGLIASGWHTAGLMMRLYVNHDLSHVASIVSPGIDELRWLQPVRPGDTLSLRVTVRDARRSRTKPDQGIVHSQIEVLNQHDALVMKMKAVNFLRCRVTQ